MFGSSSYSLAGSWIAPKVSKLSLQKAVSVQARPTYTHIYVYIIYTYNTCMQTDMYMYEIRRLALSQAVCPVSRTFREKFHVRGLRSSIGRRIVRRLPRSVTSALCGRSSYIPGSCNATAGGRSLLGRAASAPSVALHEDAVNFPRGMHTRRFVEILRPPSTFPFRFLRVFHGRTRN